MRAIHGVLFDLDGVLVDTAPSHFLAWRRMGAERGLQFGAELAELVKGVGRLGAARLVFAAAGVSVSEAELRTAAERKNELYLDLIADLDASALLPGAVPTLGFLTGQGIPVALASASANAQTILERTGIRDLFTAVVDGTTTRAPKPDPAVFREAARQLGLDPRVTVVVEDAVAGVMGARNAGCAVIGIGDPAVLHQADFVAADLTCVPWPALLSKELV